METTFLNPVARLLSWISTIYEQTAQLFEMLRTEPNAQNVFVSGSTNTVVYVINASKGALYSKDTVTMISISE